MKGKLLIEVSIKTTFLFDSVDLAESQTIILFAISNHFVLLCQNLSFANGKILFGLLSHETFMFIKYEKMGLQGG